MIHEIHFIIGNYQNADFKSIVNFIKKQNVNTEERESSCLKFCIDRQQPIWGVKLWKGEEEGEVEGGTDGEIELR